MRRLTQTFFCLAAALLLSGCFSSREPLYAEDSVSCPFTEETHFGAPLVDVNGETAYRPAFSIRADGHACVRTRDGSEPERLLLSPLGDAWYVAQQYDADDQRYYYGLVRIQGDRVLSYQPGCSDFTPEALRELGVANPWEGITFAPGESTTDVTGADTPKRPPPAPVEATEPPPQDTSGGGAMSCELTSADQLERLFHAWIGLGRQAEDYGDRIPAPAPQ